MEQCDDTALPNDEPLYEKVDSDVDKNFSLSNDSYLDSSDSNSSSLHEVSVCVFNETENVDLTLEKGDRKPNSKKRKRIIQSE